MSKKIIAVLFAVVLLVLTGCEKGGEEVTTPETPYIGGEKGIVAGFEEMGIYNEKTNTYEIYEGETFPIEITLKNKGEYDVEANGVTATLIGINLADFSGIVSNGILNNTNEIEKISEENEDGGEETLDFTSGAEDAEYLINLTGSTYDVSVFARVVYHYKTFAAVPKVCFKEDLTDESVCDVEEMKTVYSSAAPVQVKSAKEKKAGTGKIAVEFSIENVGSGQVTKPDQDFDERYDQLNFSVNEPQDWECKSGGKENEARLDVDGKAKILCRLKNPLPEDTLYTKELDLTLDYDYKELIHQQIRIKEQ